MLKISQLSVNIAEKSILKKISLDVPAGSIYALLGPNGSGKSTLASTLSGHPDLTVTAGQATLGETDLLSLVPEERAQAGLFVSFQSPVALPGVKVTTFLRAARNAQQTARHEAPLDIAPFMAELRQAFDLVGLPQDFAGRAVNDGFSGGERKRLELAQALILNPEVVIFDEIDSGLDLDAVKIVAQVVRELKQRGKAIILISHYPELLKTVAADQVGVLVDGQLVAQGGSDLIERISSHGFDQFRA
jgi:Fe-S cluster assembly ATP-binding protein